MKPGLLLLTLHNSLFAHLKEVDERRISFHQLSGLTKKKDEVLQRDQTVSVTEVTKHVDRNGHQTHIFQNDVTNTLVF